MVVASGLLAVLIGAAFAALLVAVTGFRAATNQRREMREELVAAESLQKLVIDLETGLRGFVITHEERFLQPWNQARVDLPEASRELERMAADDRVDLARVQRIVHAITAYVQQYGLPLVAAVRRNDDFASSVQATESGRERIDALRASFLRFSEAVRASLDAREAEADVASNRAIVAAIVGFAGSILVILVFTGYLTRIIVRPIRSAAKMADRIAIGDLSARLRETDVAEIGALERSFNVMASSLERSGDEVSSLLAEQAALRRVATLVAEGVPAAEIFSAVSTEVGGLLGADQAAVVRFGPDGSTTIVVGVGQDLEEIQVGMRSEADESLATTVVLRTGHAARKDVSDWEAAPGQAPGRLRSLGILSTVAGPIVVEGRIWGAMVVYAKRQPLPPDTEERLADFTELVATAIANAESRAELSASRARIVAAADSARRRIERDLHDGAQQRLVSLGLRLRSEDRAEELSWAADELGKVLDELREISRGIHPTLLADGGLGQALRAVARRSAIPVELDVQTDKRYAEAIELAAYYVVSEALTNAVKHAEVSVVRVSAEERDDMLNLWIRDDGTGGADPSRGSGLIGLKDRVEALGGKLAVVSPAGGGTTLHVRLPAFPADAPATPPGAVRDRRASSAPADAADRR
jgi:signal transduction histidine kinase